MTTPEPASQSSAVLMSSSKRKRDSLDCQETTFSSIFDTNETFEDAPCSPLSSVPDELSICSEAKKDKRVKREPTHPALEDDTYIKIVVLKVDFSKVLPHCKPQTATPLAEFQKPAQESLPPNDSKVHDPVGELVSRQSQAASKPEPSGRPLVWADSRQELCETLHYFRSYHGGGYATGGLVRGFMFDGLGHSRDYLDSRVVISRAGGGLVKDKETGEMVIGGDQKEIAQVVSLRNCMNYYNPVVIITGANNPNMPSVPPHSYCVLDYFKPTHIWTEKSKGKKFMRYRFEKLTDKPSWWTPKDTKDLVPIKDVPLPVSHECTACQQISQQIYLQGWMCLQPVCDSFWKLANGEEPIEAKLNYDPRWLQQRTPWPNDNHEYPLTSNIVEFSGLDIAGEDTSLACWLGMVCPDCGRCNSRHSWSGWECSNPACSFKKSPPHAFVPANTLHDPYFPLSAGYTLSRDMHTVQVQLTVHFAHNYRINRYSIPGIDGFVAHLIANKTVIEEPDGPDDMFEELQHIDIGLRRRPLGAGVIKGDSYTRHFSVNYGMPYKFIAATPSSSFSGAASAIISTRSRLNWASKFILGEEVAAHQDFNEVLALGYFEQQKINYHDDGEFGLGPTIATLSLGAPGSMRLRMKQRHYNGVSTAGVYDDAKPLPGCRKYTERLAVQTELAALKTKDGKAYRARLKTLPKELGLRASGQAKDAVTLTLGHGDVVVMHGAEIQKYYEHSVDHAGKLRFALTCRYIDPVSLKEADRPTYEVEKDPGEYDGARLPSAG
ncbi:hypothetical protein BCR34DRAFT_583702 [Clohesyomyces aquaticus]|uniref:Alpha-ketoglutarate-dependent dioxygenase AlkB-like domain-containing protein n=1 Tax=Clohesyomyces aquaticus TaxID=1231657 RepID=A0A1Y2A3Y0_9PLEO|nr:hypothetical protein BCR34DRAFT_583702 [Clohesyomyces aquaticus]